MYGEASIGALAYEELADEEVDGATAKSAKQSKSSGLQLATEMTSSFVLCP